MKTEYAQIYLDYNATTPCDQRVVETMLPYFNGHFGNASSSNHPYGWLAKDAIQEATKTICGTLRISSKEIIYTSGATESINGVLKELYRKNRTERNHIITTKVEHKAVLDVCKYLETEGATVTYLDVDADGLIDMEQLADSISNKTLVVAVMIANNETGVIQPLAPIADLCKDHGTLLFSDATQALGKITLDDFFEQVDFACFSGHKIYGPKGIGFTYIKEKSAEFLDAFIHGGGQQGGLRGGTYNTPAIVGLAQAIALSHKGFAEETERIASLRGQLQKGISEIEASTVNGENAKRLPNTLNMSFKHVDGDALLRALSRRLAVSNGSACNSAEVNPSHVLSAMGIPTTLALSSLRFSLGRFTTEQDIATAITIVTEEVAKQRESNILWDRRNS